MNLAPGRAVVLGLLVALFAALSGPASVGAATFTVDSEADSSDADTGDGICADAGGDCTLRAAIEEANATGGSGTIAFNIPGAGPHTIDILSDLPQLVQPYEIDGYTQPGASPNGNPPSIGTNAVLMIELKGDTSQCQFALFCMGGIAVSGQGAPCAGSHSIHLPGAS